jgi:pantoate--beta-alanine ligase
MILFKNQLQLSKHLHLQKEKGMTVGYVPTMGALHAGHLSLINESKKNTGLTVCSIFVNPTQFNDPNDYQKYPVTIEKDIYLLEKAKIDALYLPSVDDIYPGGTASLEQYDLGYLGTILEGKFRPGHFQGVCQVMHRLLEIVKPDSLYMGQKDYQQCMVVKKLLQIMGSGIKFFACPTLREPDGLAMSSRNTRLSLNERKRAIGIYEALNYLQIHLKFGDSQHFLQEAKSILLRNNFIIEYLELADVDTLQPTDHVNAQATIVALVAAFQDEIRLIDNMIIEG